MYRVKLIEKCQRLVKGQYYHPLKWRRALNGGALLAEALVSRGILAEAVTPKDNSACNRAAYTIYNLPISSTMDVEELVLNCAADSTSSNPQEDPENNRHNSFLGTKANYMKTSRGGRAVDLDEDNFRLHGTVKKGTVYKYGRQVPRSDNS